MSRPLIVAITGGSGAFYAVRLLRCLLADRRQVFLTMSPSGADVVRQELSVAVDIARFEAEKLLTSRPDWSTREIQLPDDWNELLHYCHYQDYFTPIASGSFLSGGMIVCPCSGSTMSGIARSASGNLITRAAEVQMKERRKLILVPRETPLSSIALENMHRASTAGATILPAMPGWYHDVRELDDLVDFVVARILDQLEIPHSLMNRWGDV